MEYTKQYQRENRTRVSVVLSKKYDADIIAHLDRQESKSNYIKTLIRADIQKKRKVNDATQKHNFIIKNTITFPSDRKQNRDKKSGNVIAVTFPANIPAITT